MRFLRLSFLRASVLFSLPLLHRSGHSKDSLDHQDLTLDSSQSPVDSILNGFETQLTPEALRRSALEISGKSENSEFSCHDLMMMKREAAWAIVKSRTI